MQNVRKVGTRNAQAISKIALACVARVEGTIGEIALGAASLFDRPSRRRGTEAVLLGRDPRDPKLLQDASTALRAEAAPIDDIRSTARYRVRVAENLLCDFLSSLVAGDSPLPIAREQG